ncbi:MAG: PAS domain S-box protein, partial [Candidatus Omnitrophica bacterium]|nr:PAS domain S-box protein [Candidatus Omnitrophota bacterium]
MDKNFELTSITADNLEIGMFRYEILPEQKFTCVNATLLRLLKYTHRRSFFALKLQDLFFNPKDLTVFAALLNRNDKIKLYEVPLKTEKGNEFWALLTASNVYTRDNTKCIEAVVQDISYKKEINSKLLMEKDLLQSLFDNIPDAVYFKDRNNRIVKVNKFYTQGTGMDESQILGKTDFDFFPFEQAKEMFDDDRHILKTGKPVVGKIEKTLLPSGNWNKVITTKIPMHDKKGRIIGTMGTTRDMTLQANFEEERINMVINALEVLGKALEMRD